MKNFYKQLSLLLFGSMALFASCSKDGDNEPNLEGVPSGEIVSIEERDEALTGFSELKSTEESQKWWTHIMSSVDYSSSCGIEDVEYEYTGYYAFYPDGEYYYKSSLSSSGYQVGTWAWTDESKNKIYLYNATMEAGTDMTITYLNEDNLVIGSYQSAGDCSATTYEQFGNPQ